MKEIVVVTYHILFLSALLSKNDLTEQYSFLHNLGKNVSFRCGCIATCFGMKTRTFLKLVSGLIGQIQGLTGLI